MLPEPDVSRPALRDDRQCCEFRGGEGRPVSHVMPEEAVVPEDLPDAGAAPHLKSPRGGGRRCVDAGWIVAVRIDCHGWSPFGIGRDREVLSVRPCRVVIGGGHTDMGRARALVKGAPQIMRRQPYCGRYRRLIPDASRDRFRSRGAVPGLHLAAPVVLTRLHALGRGNLSRPPCGPERPEDCTLSCSAYLRLRKPFPFGMKAIPSAANCSAWNGWSSTR